MIKTKRIELLNRILKIYEKIINFVDLTIQ